MKPCSMSQRSWIPLTCSKPLDPLLLSWLLNAVVTHRDSLNITRANVGAWSAGHPAVIASATYCAQPLGAVVVVVVGIAVNAMVAGGVLFRFVVI